MKVHHDNVIYKLQQRGGITTYWQNLQAVLKQKVSLVTTTPIKHSLGLTRYLDVKVLEGAEVFHSSFYRLPQNKSIRTITTVHDFIHEKLSSHGYLSSKINTIQKYRAVKLSDEIICVSENTRQDLLERYNWIPEQNVHKVHLAVNRADFFFEKELKDCQFIENSILFVGNRFGYKNFSKCVEVIKRTKLNLIIVGAPLNKTEKMLLQSISFSRWRLYSNCSNNKVRRLYSTCFALFYPSEYEGFGLPLIEAYACKCPVVHSGKGSLSEVLNSSESYISKTGSVDEYINNLKCLEMIENRTKLFEMYEEKLSYYSWNRVGKETLKIYKNGIKE